MFFFILFQKIHLHIVGFDRFTGATGQSAQSPRLLSNKSMRDIHIDKVASVKAQSPPELPYYKIYEIFIFC